MGNVRLYGSTSGYTELAPPAVAPDGVLSLPSGTGTLATTADVAAIVPGKILQVVNSVITHSATSSSTTYVDTGLFATITPTSATSTILVFINLLHGKYPGSTDSYFQCRLDRNGTVLTTSGPLAYNITSSYLLGMTYGLMYKDSPATTSSLTYKMQFHNGVNTASVTAGYGGPSSITLMEISA